MPLETVCLARENYVRELLRNDHAKGESLPRTLPEGWYGRAKLALEWLAAAVLLVLTAPLMLLAAALVKLTSRGPILYSQVRLGLDGRPYRIHKIRTMAHDCEKKSGPCWATAHDPRITRIGRILRKTHLDELPQLWNVLKGEMSLVGPRPERPEFVTQLERAIPHYRDRLLIRPGVTGLAQVQLPADSDLASVRKKLAYDLYYVRHMGLRMDLQILCCTAFHMVGVPYSILGKVFLIPDQETVEGAYRNLPAPDGAVIQMLPA